MPDRLIPFLDSIFATFVSFAMLITFTSVLTVTAAILSILWWVGQFKKEIEKNHNGKFFQWLKWLVKKN